MMILKLFYTFLSLVFFLTFQIDGSLVFWGDGGLMRPVRGGPSGGGAAGGVWWQQDDRRRDGTWPFFQCGWSLFYGFHCGNYFFGHNDQAMNHYKQTFTINQIQHHHPASFVWRTPIEVTWVEYGDVMLNLIYCKGLLMTHGWCSLLPCRRSLPECVWVMAGLTCAHW